jgi:hypothetical protein
LKIRPELFSVAKVFVQDETRAFHVELLNWVEEGVRATKWHGPIKRKLAGLQGGK